MARRSNSLFVDEGDISWLDETPVLSFVCDVVRVVKWYEIGIQLKLDETSLNEIDRDNPTTSLKRTKMFGLWLTTQPNATNRQLLDVLRLKGVGENKIAKQYEEIIKINLSLIASNSFSKNEGL